MVEDDVLGIRTGADISAVYGVDVQRCFSWVVKVRSPEGRVIVSESIVAPGRACDGESIPGISSRAECHVTDSRIRRYVMWLTLTIAAQTKVFMRGLLKYASFNAKYSNFTWIFSTYKQLPRYLGSCGMDIWAVVG